MTNYDKLMNAKGYYCNMCDTYHTDNELKHRYTVESVGVWDGSNGVIVAHEMECPTCRHDDELEDFDRTMWSHLRAYRIATDTPMTFVYPLFDRATNGPTYGYDDTPCPDELEKIADRYCIDVLAIEERDGEIVVTVDFQ
jgi:hypothetical protein